MILIKQNFILRFLVLCYILSLSHALECKVCEHDDHSCLFAQDVETRQCEYDDDLCYSWYSRTGHQIGVQRNCISIVSPEYSLIQQAIGDDRDNSCVKRIHGLDCFLCSTNLCN